MKLYVSLNINNKFSIYYYCNFYASQNLVPCRCVYVCVRHCLSSMPVGIGSPLLETSFVSVYPNVRYTKWHRKLRQSGVPRVCVCVCVRFQFYFRLIRATTQEHTLQGPRARNFRSERRSRTLWSGITTLIDPNPGSSLGAHKRR